MKVGANKSIEFKSFGFEVLNDDAMNAVRGGKIKPKTKDKDQFDLDEEFE